jgi:hypothetical protein
MADFCFSCTADVFLSEEERKEILALPITGGDLFGLCEPGEVAAAVCEECGFIWVNELGVCVSACSAKHGTVPCWNLREIGKTVTAANIHMLGDVPTIRKA